MRKFLDKILNIVTILFIGFMIYYQGKQLVFFFDDKTKVYAYSELPPHIKSYLNEFEHEASHYGKDVSKIKKIKYVLLNSDLVNFGGYYLRMADYLFLNENRPYSTKAVLWHELGHGLFNYGHDFDSSVNPIMRPTGPCHLSWEDQKSVFFTKPVATSYLKETINTFKIWHWEEIKHLANKSLNTNSL